MPIKVHYSNGKAYYQFGSTGKKYYYIPHNAKSRAIAKSKCHKQARAIEYRKNYK
jgi:hypothetical protein